MLSRKEFFKQCLTSIGKSIIEVREAVGPASAQVHSAPTMPPQPEPGGEQLAVPRNRFCMAKGGGCATCLEQCKQQAIQLVPGEGIQIDPDLCVGCGTCEKHCPAAPSAVQLRDRSQQH